MKIIVGDIWNVNGMVVVPTNLSYNRLDQAIMGRGVAYQASKKFPDLRHRLGKLLHTTNRAPYLHVFTEWQIICFPVKKYWSDAADLNMIRPGLRRLVELADDLAPIYLPLLGCGFGELEESKVLPVLTETLDDRFTLVKRAGFVQQKYPRSFGASVRVDRSLGT